MIGDLNRQNLVVAEVAYRRKHRLGQTDPRLYAAWREILRKSSAKYYQTGGHGGHASRMK